MDPHGPFGVFGVVGANASERAFLLSLSGEDDRTVVREVSAPLECCTVGLMFQLLVWVVVGVKTVKDYGGGGSLVCEVWMVCW